MKIFGRQMHHGRMEMITGTLITLSTTTTAYMYSIALATTTTSSFIY